MEWYRDYPHMGYDLSGKKIMKPKTGDELDNLIEQSENPDYWYAQSVMSILLLYDAAHSCAFEPPYLENPDIQINLFSLRCAYCQWH